MCPLWVTVNQLSSMINLACVSGYYRPVQLMSLVDNSDALRASVDMDVTGARATGLDGPRVHTAATYYKTA